MSWTNGIGRLLKKQLEVTRNRMRLVRVDVLRFVARWAVKRARVLLLSVKWSEELWEDADG